MGRMTDERLVYFKVQNLDLGHQQGIAVCLHTGQIQATRIQCHMPPRHAAQALRALADWIDNNYKV